MKVAAEHAKTHGERSRQRVKERFLFDRIELKGRDVAVGNQKCAAAIEAYTANSVQSVEDDAAMTAGKTPHTAVFEPFVKFAWD
jgi:hypothetical protein